MQNNKNKRRVSGGFPQGADSRVGRVRAATQYSGHVSRENVRWGGCWGAEGESSWLDSSELNAANMWLCFDIKLRVLTVNPSAEKIHSKPTITKSVSEVSTLCFLLFFECESSVKNLHTNSCIVVLQLGTAKSVKFRLKCIMPWNIDDANCRRTFAVVNVRWSFQVEVDNLILKETSIK